MADPDVRLAVHSVVVRGVQAGPIGRDELVWSVPTGASVPPRGKQPLRDLEIPFSTYDRGAEEIRARLIALGARARLGATLATTVTMARRRGVVALVPRSALAGQLLPGEHLAPAPFRYRLTLSLVTGSTPDPRIVRVLPQLRRELTLSAVRRPT